jgi:hypothetical protein
MGKRRRANLPLLDLPEPDASSSGSDSDDWETDESGDEDALSAVAEGDEGA